MEQGKPGCNREECIMLNAHFMMSPWGEPCYQDVWQEFSAFLVPCRDERGGQDNSPRQKEMMVIVVRDETVGNESPPSTIMQAGVQPANGSGETLLKIPKAAMQLHAGERPSGSSIRVDCEGTDSDAGGLQMEYGRQLQRQLPMTSPSGIIPSPGCGLDLVTCF